MANFPHVPRAMKDNGAISLDEYKVREYVGWLNDGCKTTAYLYRPDPKYPHLAAITATVEQMLSNEAVNIVYIEPRSAYVEPGRS